MRKLFCCFLFAALTLAAQSKPRIRAVTAFIEINRDNYVQRVTETAQFLADAKKALNAAGFEGAGGRITTQPFPQFIKGMTHQQAIALVRNLLETTTKSQIRLNIGPAMLNDNDDPSNVALLTDIMAEVNVDGNLIMADENGIHWHAISEAAKLVKTLADRSPHGNATFNFAAIAMMKPYGPYYPGSYHLGKGHAFAVAMEGAALVADVFAKEHDPAEAEKQLGQALARYTSEAEKVAKEVAAKTGWTYEGIDATPAPSLQSSIATAIENFTGAPFGSPGTMTASGIITRAVQSTSVKRVGYSGLMIPVMEDRVLAQRWTEGTYNLDSILAYSAVCAGGVDTVPLPGDVTIPQIERMLSDVAWLAWKWNKPLGARLMPAPGKGPGDKTEFSGGGLVNTTVQAVPGSPRR
jgi:uncharacterized protein (UPF0210 family)